MERLELNYLEEYEPVLLDPKEPFTIRKDDNLPSFYTRIAGSSQTFLKRLPMFLALAVIIPIASIAFLINSTIQTMRSRRRIQLHETDYEGRGFSGYRVPFMVQDAQQAIEDAFENVNSAQRQEYLPDGSEEMTQVENDPSRYSTSLLPDSLAEPVPSEKTRNNSVGADNFSSRTSPRILHTRPYACSVCHDQSAGRCWISQISCTHSQE